MKLHASWIIPGILLSTASIGAHADLVVIVSTSNPNASLSQNEVQKIFLGKTKKFPQGGTALVVDQSPGPARTSFLDKTLGKSETQWKAYWSALVFTGSGQPPKAISSEQEIVDLVGKNPNIIGYVDRARVNDSVRVVMTVQ